MSARKRVRRVTWREAWPIWLTFAVIFGSGVLGLWSIFPYAQIPSKALLQDEDLKINAGDIRLDQPRLFAFPLESGHTAEFFITRDAGKKITVAFASCRRCYRAGHYQQNGQILCARCNAPMMQATPGQTLSAEKDCTQIQIPFESASGRLTIRASTVRDVFTRWYGPVISQEQNSVNGIGKLR